MSGKAGRFTVRISVSSGTGICILAPSILTPSEMKPDVKVLFIRGSVQVEAAPKSPQFDRRMSRQWLNICTIFRAMSFISDATSSQRSKQSLINLSKTIIEGTLISLSVPKNSPRTIEKKLHSAKNPKERTFRL